MSSRLARAREQLQRRLTRRGVLLSAAICAVELSRTAATAAVEPSFLDCTVKAAWSFAAGKAVSADLISVEVTALAKGVIQSLFMSKVKIAIALILGFGLLAPAGLLTHQAIAGKLANVQGPWWQVFNLPATTRQVENLPPRAQASRTNPPTVPESADPPQGDETLPARQDRLGDPLPPGAVARMGSSRLRHLTHMAYIESIVSPDSKTLLTISEYGIRAWSLATGKLLYQIQDEFGFHPVFSPDGKWLAVPGKEIVRLRDPRDRSEAWPDPC